MKNHSGSENEREETISIEDSKCVCLVAQPLQPRSEMAAHLQHSEASSSLQSASIEAGTINA